LGRRLSTVETSGQLDINCGEQAVRC
jgi:hypothetical protein